MNKCLWFVKKTMTFQYGLHLALAYFVSMQLTRCDAFKDLIPTTPTDRTKSVGTTEEADSSLSSPNGSIVNSVITDLDETPTTRHSYFNMEHWSSSLFGSFLSTLTAVGQMLTTRGDKNIEDSYLTGIGEKMLGFARIVGGNIRLYLFRSKKSTRGQYFNLTMLQTSNMNLTEDKVTLIIHGFTQGSFFAKREHNQHHSLIIKDAIMKIEKKSSVILVDWTYLSSSVDYFSSSKATSLVGDELADLLTDLIKRNLINLSTTRIIGFSLGAHIAGVIGHSLHKKTGLILPRIDALDPAGPNFDIFTDMKLQLSQSDAAFVQVIHCNTKTFGTTLTSRGHVEFYPNGGQIQPGCDETSLLAQNDSGYPTNIALEYCNHVKCNDIYADGILTEQLACPCATLKMFQLGNCDCSKETAVRMGYSCPLTSHGSYYLKVPISEDISTVTSSFNDAQNSQETT